MTPIQLDYKNSDARSLIRLGSEWNITPTDSLLGDLAAEALVSAVRMKYSA
jgi:hypothetical protein